MTLLTSEEPAESAWYAETARILVEDHIRYLPSEAPLQVASADPEAVAEWFQSRLDFAIRGSALPGADLLGGRLCYMREARVALLLYSVAGRRVSLFALPDQGPPPEAGVRCGWAHRGFTVCMRATDGVLYAAVADLSSDRLQSLLAEPQN